MPIPALTPAGHLPAGEHICNFTEFENTFAHNDHRSFLLGKLKDFLEFLSSRGLRLPYYLDGSYSTDKLYPRDIDFVLDCSGATGQQVRDAFGLMASQVEIKAEFYVDFWVYFPGAPSDLRAYFQYVRVEEMQAKNMSIGSRKGILRIDQ
jgi:hypothetical protein